MLARRRARAAAVERRDGRDVRLMGAVLLDVIAVGEDDFVGGEGDELELHVVEVGVSAGDAVEVAVEGVGQLRVVIGRAGELAIGGDEFAVGEALHACASFDEGHLGLGEVAIDEVIAEAAGGDFEVIGGDDAGSVIDVAHDDGDGALGVADSWDVVEVADQFAWGLIAEFDEGDGEDFG
jgi:hypothetical protein